ncbi:hypothetical protein F5J12DRAFT_726143 [Pisolithus orientalis]|uniref:uncharacterized protein n=1 Tax=Pisolithus orientalis TaxID=936130 RepID=UPI002225752B|nr:uncharacterized protein F5J12DRAFT_726143 [Pisolithus orientalis]KAI5995349.1 hypothetical protein F5J12DRAFT_726143 [Pisolithus orientalis]
MTHIAPAVSLTWAILSLMLGSFLVYHLWSFDRFKCLKWNRGPHSGAFKRIMTYTYISSVTLVITFAVGFAVIKYQYGYSFIPGYGIIPTPYQLWSERSRNAILPLYLCFSFAWSSEMYVIYTELCFWVFLVKSTSAEQDWFRTVYFKAWAIGSCVATIYMPLVTIFTRDDVLKCEAYTMLAGSMGDFFLTIWFLPVLWTFPSFIENLKQSNVDKNTLIRLTKFHELNVFISPQCIRIMFRFLFTIPCIILGVDGVRPHQHINDKRALILGGVKDLLAIVAGIGVVMSSGITLVIFFPRSIEGEMAERDASRDRKHSRANRRARSQFMARLEHAFVGNDDVVYIAPSVKSHARTTELNDFGRFAQGERGWVNNSDMDVFDVKVVGSGVLLQPNRRTESGDVEFGGMMTNSRGALFTRHGVMQRSEVNRLVHIWRSPIGESCTFFRLLVG